MKFTACFLMPAALALVGSAQMPCGVPGVTVTVAPSAAAIGQPIQVTLDNQSNQTITLPSSCVFDQVFPGASCSGSAVLNLFCLSVLTPIAPGQSMTQPWDQLDDNASQVPAGTYSIPIQYFDTNFTMQSCCVSFSIVQGPINYCTAGTTTNNCNAMMGSSGTPTAGAPSGFTLTCSIVEGQKTGMFFYGITGQIASPWGGGSTSFLCVKTPTQRTTIQSSGGTANACNGQYSLDFLTYLATHSSALGAPGTAGQTFDAQAWFRDPLAPKTSNLSDGLEFTLVP